MMTTRASVLGVALVAAAIGGATTTVTRPAEASTGAALIAACATAAPDHTVLWGANEGTVGYSSPSNQYVKGNCDAYVVDFDVSHSTATVGYPYDAPVQFGGDDPNVTSTGALSVNVPQSRCNTYQQTALIYKKVNGAWQFVAGGTARGVWSSGGLFGASCNLVNETGYKDAAGPGGETGAFNPPASGTDVFRVAVKVTNTGNPPGTSIYGMARAYGVHSLVPPT